MSGLPDRASTSHSSFALGLARRAAVLLLTIAARPIISAGYYCILKTLHPPFEIP